MRGRRDRILGGALLLIGMLMTVDTFSVTVTVEPPTPKPEERLKVKCAYTLNLSATDLVIFEDKVGQPVCTFEVPLGKVTCTTNYASQVVTNSSVDGLATLGFQLQKCSNQTGFRCTVHDTMAAVQNGNIDFNIQNVPSPTIACVDDTCTNVDGDPKKLQFANNTLQNLRCSVAGAKPELTVKWTEYTETSNSSIEDKSSCTYDQTSTATPTQPITNETSVTCSVETPDGITNSTSVKVFPAPPETTTAATTTAPPTTTTASPTTTLELTTTTTASTTASQATTTASSTASQAKSSMTTPEMKTVSMQTTYEQTMISGQTTIKKPKTSTKSNTEPTSPPATTTTKSTMSSSGDNIREVTSKVKCTLNNDFMESLSNPASKEARALTAAISGRINQIMMATYGGQYKGSQNYKYSEGSIIVEFDIILNSQSPDSKIASDVGELVKDALGTPLSANGTTYTVDPDSITVTVPGKGVNLQRVLLIVGFIVLGVFALIAVVACMYNCYCNGRNTCYRQSNDAKKGYPNHAYDPRQLDRRQLRPEPRRVFPTISSELSGRSIYSNPTQSTYSYPPLYGMPRSTQIRAPRAYTTAGPHRQVIEI